MREALNRERSESSSILILVYSVIEQVNGVFIEFSMKKQISCFVLNLV